MPPHRLVLFLVAAVGLPTLLTFFSLLHSHPGGKLATEDESDSPRSGIRAFFSFHTPSTLFPPSAIISLTDDNSTFFLARPADFGPSLSSNGLSGQLWVGSGFGEDDLGRSGAGAGAEGELGCSDVPGWVDGNQKHPSTNTKRTEASRYITEEETLDSHVGDSKAPRTSASEITGTELPSKGDGTDDHLHHPLPSSPVSKPSGPGHSTQRESDRKGHADIQSLQESAEITGKIALLSRGGCGFLEKVKWAQRRGATAIIVGDHTRGGALVTMYARGDTSNITIPSLFASHTTAHLLSSLIPPDDVDDTAEAAPDTVHSGHSGEDSTDEARNHAEEDKSTFKLGHRPRATTGPKTSNTHKQTLRGEIENRRTKPKATSSWLSSLWQFFGASQHRQERDLHSDSRRPPSSGRLDWFGEKPKDGKSKDSKSNTKIQATPTPTLNSKDNWKLASHSSSSDDFVIGVQDWRDPDLVVGKPVSIKGTTKTTTKIPLATQPLLGKAGKEALSEQRSSNVLTGGSITPGSGEYHKPGLEDESQSSSDKTHKKGSRKSPSGESPDTHPSEYNTHPGIDEEHEGLWVTLTPTTMSTSPFFDTLLVLVVSPLITLTVVYALLLLRSRIRRRRWRAPKSVVDRLPIRTYHTMSCSSTASSIRFASPQSSSPTSPLLQSSIRSTTHQPRPRSSSTSIIGDTVSSSPDQATAKASRNQNEKGYVSPKKRNRYNGRQIECVVCLEEYVDGHSRVMSLPCGHEFHAECITPWLTTRRRTCPICKGDVVRSMAQPSKSAASDTMPRFRDNASEGDIQVQAAETTNDSPTAAIPIPCENADLEQGEDLAATLVNEDLPESSASRSRWEGFTAISLGAFSGEATVRKAHEDRDR
ncbi:MAG: hypothetical protein Q9217_005877 [Psora testacea]